MLKFLKPVSFQSSPQAGEPAPSGDQHSPGGSIPIFFQVCMALGALTEAVVVAKPALQGLKTRSIQLAAIMLEEIATQRCINLKGESAFAPFKGGREHPK